MTTATLDSRRAFVSKVMLSSAVTSLAPAQAPATATNGDTWAVHKLHLCGDWSGAEIVSVYAIGNGNNGTDHWRSDDVGDFIGAQRVKASPIKYDQSRGEFAFDVFLWVGPTNSDDVSAFFRILRRSKHGAQRYGVFAAAFKFPDTPT